jgi:hypothetical protein
MASRRNKINIKIEDHATKALQGVALTLRSPQITQEMQRGAEIMAHAVKQRAPVRTGALKGGVYTASSLKDNRPTIMRKSTNVVQGLRYPPRKGQVLVVSGTYYGRWVESGRKKKAGSDGGRSVGRMKRRPFFRPGIRAARPSAESYIRRRIERLIQEKAGR